MEYNGSEKGDENVELLQLRYFLESAGSESFSQTARRYDVPVTSVSASVKRLERELGHDLFYRRANKIFLNERGRRLYEALSVGMATVDDALEAASDGKAEGRAGLSTMNAQEASAQSSGRFMYFS